jgi:cytochrome c553
VRWMLIGTAIMALKSAALVADQTSAASGTATADTRIGTGNPAAGKQKLQSEVCQACHGENGVSISDIIPSLSGQFAPYIIKEVQDFRGGRRKDPLMSKMAEDIDDATIVDIAAYFASFPPAQVDHGDKLSAGGRLYLNGDAASHIAACASCHGVDGSGAALGQMVAPALSGQPRVYLRYQLLKWRAGDRNNDPTATMPGIARALSSNQIDEVARYLSGEE